VKLGTCPWKKGRVDISTVLINLLPSLLNFLVFQVVQLDNRIFKLLPVTSCKLLLLLQLLILTFHLLKHCIYLIIDSLFQLLVFLPDLLGLLPDFANVDLVKIIAMTCSPEKLLLSLYPQILLLQLKKQLLRSRD
jgi:hypothetical protein